MNFGDRLKKLRKEKGLSQESLGKVLNISRRVIGYYESNERFPKDENTLKAIADYFECTTDYLLGRTDRKEVVVIEGNEIPKELKDVGIDYMEVNKIAKDKGFTPQDIKEILETIDKIKNNNQ